MAGEDARGGVGQHVRSDRVPLGGSGPVRALLEFVRHRSDRLGRSDDHQWQDQYGDQMLIFKETPEATLRYLIEQSKNPTDDYLPLLNLEEPEKILHNLYKTLTSYGVILKLYYEILIFSFLSFLNRVLLCIPRSCAAFVRL